MLAQFLKYLQGNGLKIDTVYDIGATRGEWSLQAKKYMLPNSKFVLFEANPEYDQDLRATGFQFFNGVALSNPGRESVEFYNGTNTGDSYYKETTAYYDHQTAITLPCVTVDDLIKRHRLSPPNFIKLDTQGSELDILHGAESVIDTVDLIYTECPIICYNKGAPDMGEYLAYFKSKKFVPVNIFETHQGDNMLLQVDIMFIRHDTKQRYLSPDTVIRPLI